MLQLRPLHVDDERSFRSAVQEFLDETPPWEFAFHYDENEDFKDYVARVSSWTQGVDGFVPNSYLVAVVGEKVVGRASIRHELNDYLRQYGGHIGYGVVPSERRKGYATEILRQALEVCLGFEIKRVMVSCDTDNVGSRKVIEKNGGVFERETNIEGLDKQKLIYHIDPSAFS